RFGHVAAGLLDHGDGLVDLLLVGNAEEGAVGTPGPDVQRAHPCEDGYVVTEHAPHPLALQDGGAGDAKLHEAGKNVVHQFFVIYDGDEQLHAFLLAECPTRNRTVRRCGVSSERSCYDSTGRVDREGGGDKTTGDSWRRTGLSYRITCRGAWTVAAPRSS